jgi:hypothetical protein
VVFKVETLEGTNEQSKHIMESLEEALKDIADETQLLHERLGPALAALLHSAETVDLGLLFLPYSYLIATNK